MMEESTEKDKAGNVLHYEKLLQGIKEVQQCLECPICFENNGVMVQCSIGHFTCVRCRDEMVNCPFCRSPFTNAKCFFIEDITRKLKNLKVSLTALHADIELHNEKVKDYKTCRQLVKTVTSKLSTFLYKTHNNLKYLSKYINSPNVMNSTELVIKLGSLTSDLHGVQYLMDDTKNTLITLKK